MFIDESDGVSKAPKLEHAVEGPYPVLEKNQHIVVIQQKDLFERIKADTVAFAPLPTGIILIPPQSASAVDIQDKNLQRTPCLFHVILDHYL